MGSIEFWASVACPTEIGCLADAKLMNQGHSLKVLETATVVELEPNWEEMNTDQLRKDCTRYGIRWRNAHGKQHMKNFEQS